MTSAPDAASPYVGLRGWRIASDPKGRPALTAVVARRRWPAGLALEAECFHAERHPEAPVASCTCGIYSTQRLIEIRRLLLRQRYHAAAQTGPLCIGTVKQWGKVILHEHGARSQLAYPERVFIPDRWRGRSLRTVARELADAYGVHVEALSPELMSAWGTSEWDRTRALNDAASPVRDWRTVLGDTATG